MIHQQTHTCTLCVCDTPFFLFLLSIHSRWLIPFLLIPAVFFRTLLRSTALCQTSSYQDRLVSKSSRIRRLSRFTVATIHGLLLAFIFFFVCFFCNRFFFTQLLEIWYSKSRTAGSLLIRLFSRFYWERSAPVCRAFFGLKGVVTRRTFDSHTQRRKTSTKSRWKTKTIKGTRITRTLLTSLSNDINKISMKLTLEDEETQADGQKMNTSFVGYFSPTFPDAVIAWKTCIFFPIFLLLNARRWRTSRPEQQPFAHLLLTCVGGRIKQLTFALEETRAKTEDVLIERMKRR